MPFTDEELVLHLAEVYAQDPERYRGICERAEQQGHALQESLLHVEVSGMNGEILVAPVLLPSSTILQVKDLVAAAAKCQVGFVALFASLRALDNDDEELSAFDLERPIKLTAVIKRIPTHLEILVELSENNRECVLVSKAGADVNGVYVREDEFRGSARFVSSHPPRDVWLRIGTAGYWCFESKREGYPGNEYLIYAWRKPGGPEGQWPESQAGTVTIGRLGQTPSPLIESAAMAIARLEQLQEQ